MSTLEDLYSEHKSCGDNDLCNGCSILNKSKPVHAVMDYEKKAQCDVLFLSDSLTHKFGDTKAFSNQEYNLIKECAKGEFETAASVKCPSVREVDMSPANMKICRQHLEDTLDKIQPKLVFPCGNLAMKMLIKKSGITNKRGRSYTFETEKGHEVVVVPIFHPFSVLQEPKNRYLFETDIRNAYEKYIQHKTCENKFTYNVVDTKEKLRDLANKLSSITEPVACDIETTGLDFRRDKIMTIAFSTDEGNWVVPCEHKDTPFTEPDQKAALWFSIRKILENEKSRKIFHNAKFDLKFLINYGIYPSNIWDTKILHHILNENTPKGLMDLVKLYFSDELENL